MFVGIHFYSQANLSQIAQALGDSGLLLRPPKGGQEQRGKNRERRHHHQQLDQSERRHLKQKVVAGSKGFNLTPKRDSSLGGKKLVVRGPFQLKTFSFLLREGRIEVLIAL